MNAHQIVRHRIVPNPAWVDAVAANEADAVPVGYESALPEADPVMALHREEARAGMQMLAIVVVAALCGAAALVSTVITYVWMS